MVGARTDDTGFTASASDTNTFTPTGHRFYDGDRVYVLGALPGGLPAGTRYYVVGATETTFKLASTLGGDAIDITPPAVVQVVLDRLARQTGNSEFTGLQVALYAAAEGSVDPTNDLHGRLSTHNDSCRNGRARSSGTATSSCSAG